MTEYTDYTERALTLIDQLRDRKAITIRERGCLRRAILEHQPKVRQWQKFEFGESIKGTAYECQCGRIVLIKEDYCPTCGARMIEPTGDPFIADMVQRLKEINTKTTGGDA